MKYLYTILLTVFLPLFSASNVETLLAPYKEYLEWGTYYGGDWSYLPSIPKSRYDTFKTAFELFEKNNGKVIVELGTSRSFVHGGLIGCNLDDRKYWHPDQPADWDWGAGFFTRMAAVALGRLNPEIHTVDLITGHINRCRVMLADYSSIMRFHVSDSVAFLKNTPFPNGIDLLYLDTGDMTPIEPTALLQLEEAKVVVERNLIPKGGILLIDDVKNTTPRKFGDTSGLGKSKYALPFLLKNGFELIADEYQVILRKK